MSETSEQPRRFYVRTYGCQMNEHDSERIAGLLASEGMEATDDLESADVVVLNTCCIRENADNKLYGNLGVLKRWKGERDGRQIVVAGCLAQKDQGEIQRKAPWVDVVVGTHALPHLLDLLDRVVVAEDHFDVQARALARGARVGGLHELELLRRAEQRHDDAFFHPPLQLYRGGPALFGGGERFMGSRLSRKGCG